MKKILAIFALFSAVCAGDRKEELNAYFLGASARAGHPEVTFNQFLESRGFSTPACTGVGVVSGGGAPSSVVACCGTGGTDSVEGEVDISSVAAVEDSCQMSSCDRYLMRTVDAEAAAISADDIARRQAEVDHYLRNN